MKQNQKILNYIDRFGSITPLQAQNELGIMRLASRINELRADGHKIKTVILKGVSRDGTKTHYAKYEYEKENENGSET